MLHAIQRHEVLCADFICHFPGHPFLLVESHNFSGANWMITLVAFEATPRILTRFLAYSLPATVLHSQLVNSELVQALPQETERRSFFPISDLMSNFALLSTEFNILITVIIGPLSEFQQEAQLEIPSST
jgi:hypothetical protein